MSTEVLAVIGVVFGGLCGLVAARLGALGASFGYQPVTAGRQPVEQRRLSVAEARAARREEQLCQDLVRLERLASLLKRMWAVVNWLDMSATKPPIPRTAVAGLPTPGEEMDGAALRLAGSAHDVRPGRDAALPPLTERPL